MATSQHLTQLQEEAKVHIEALRRIYQALYTATQAAAPQPTFIPVPTQGTEQSAAAAAAAAAALSVTKVTPQAVAPPSVQLVSYNPIPVLPVSMTKAQQDFLFGQFLYDTNYPLLNELKTKPFAQGVYQSDQIYVVLTYFPLGNEVSFRDDLAYYVKDTIKPATQRAVLVLAAFSSMESLSKVELPDGKKVRFFAVVQGTGQAATVLNAHRKQAAERLLNALKSGQ
jgi:hypothetical protein